MFFRLGFVNITRQLSRSVLALLSFVIAAVSLTNSLAISLGYPALAFKNYRDYLGGDIMVYPINIMGNLTEESQELQLRRLPDDPFSTITTFYPHLNREGFLADQLPALLPFSEKDTEGLAEHKEISSAQLLYRMPAWRDTEFAVSLRSVPTGADLWEYQDGPVLEEAQSRALPVWLNSRYKDHQSAEIGMEMTLTLPRIWLAADGSLRYDSGETFSQTVVVAGFYQLPTRIISWPNPNGDGFLSEQGYFSHDEIWLHTEAWEELWARASNGLKPRAGSLALKVKNMSILEATIGELQVANPQWTIVSAPNLAKRSEANSLLDSFHRAPRELWADIPVKAQHAFPLDMSRLLSIFVYLNAGLLMAARMLTGAAARKKEIGVLKTLGARRRDILIMALAEAIVLCVIGSSIGFLFAYPAAFMQQLTNKVPWSQIGYLFIKNYTFILGQTLLTSIIFGLLPAWLLSKLTVNEVLHA